MHKITLQDGTVLDSLELNGNNYIAKGLIGDVVFADNLATVEIYDGEQSQVFEDMKLVANQIHDGKSWFILAEKTLQEKEKEALEHRIEELEASIVATDNEAQDLKRVLIEKDIIKASDMEGIKEVIK